MWTGLINSMESDQLHKRSFSRTLLDGVFLNHLMVQDLHMILQNCIFSSSRLMLKLVILYCFTLNKPMGISVARACNQISNALLISFHRLTQDQSDHYKVPTSVNFDSPLLQNKQCSEQIFSNFFGEGNINYS